MSFTGRPKSVNFEGNNFSLLREGNKYAAYCNFCKKTLQNTAESRLLAHRKRCNGFFSQNDGKNIDEAAEEISNMDSSSNSSILMLNYSHQDQSLMSIGGSLEGNNEDGEVIYISEAHIDSEDSDLITAATTSSSSLLTSSGSSLSFTKPVKPSAKKVSKQKNIGNLNSFVDRLKPGEKHEIELAIATFFFGCNIPIHNIESAHFKNMIKSIRPSYAAVLPKRKTLSDQLLDKIYNKCIEDFRSTTQNDSVLLIDGWKNSSSNSKTVVTMLHNSQGKRAFLNAWDLSGEIENADMVSDIVYQSIDMGKNMYNVSFYAVVSDNASVMLRMGKNVGHVLWHSRCNSHLGNLFAKDIVDKSLAEKVNLILKEFKNPDLEKSIVSKGGKRLKLSCQTRWCSYRDSFESFLNNLQLMKQIIADGQPRKVKSTISKLIFDEDFVARVDNNQKMLEPICELINKCQALDTSVADAVNMWLSLRNKNGFKESMMSCYLERKEMALNEISLTAYYLNPFYDKTILSTSEEQIINHFLMKNLDADGLESLHCFRQKTDIFESLFRKEIKKPTVFWSTANIHHPQLSSLALKLLNIPASSAQIERVFSNWAQIHNPLRNRLTFERSKKLIHVYFSLNSTNVDYVDIETE